MDSKKVLEKLVKIAESQQKAINKLAQQVGLQPPPTGLTPAAPAHDVITALKTHLPANVQRLVDLANPGTKVVGNSVQLATKPGGNTQAVMNAVSKTLADLVSKNLVAGGPFTVSLLG